MRVKSGSRVRSGDGEMRLDEVGKALTYTEMREVECQGKPATQWLASTRVVLARKAKPGRLDADGKRIVPQAGRPLDVRLVASRILDGKGQVLAEWYLLSNVVDEVPAETLALWYYYRWRIESYFKLLKQAGHQVESWEQESGEALFKRLLIVTQACALAWRIMRAEGEFAQQAKNLFGSAVRAADEANAPRHSFRFAGRVVQVFVMIETLENYTFEELKRFARFALFQQDSVCKRVV